MSLVSLGKGPELVSATDGVSFPASLQPAIDAKAIVQVVEERLLLLRCHAADGLGRGPPKGTGRFRNSCARSIFSVDMKKSMRALVCLMGVVPRSILSTWPAFRENLLRVLEKECSHVRLYVYNLDTGNTPVDGVVMEQGDMRIIPADVIEQQQQADVDRIVNTKCISSCFRSSYTEENTRNAMRQLHTEYMVGKYVESVADEFDVVVVCTADARLARPICMEHVREAAAGTQVFTSRVNNAEGYTNGFYVGGPRALLPILKRYIDFEPSHRDYEYTVKRAFDMHKVKHGFTDMVFWKIRGNGEVFWAGGQDTSFLDKTEAARVRALYKRDGGCPASCPCILVFVLVVLLLLLLAVLWRRSHRP